jgi:hypothetical protein
MNERSHCSHHHQRLLVAVFYIMATTIGMKQYLTIALLSILPMTDDVEHLYRLLCKLCIFFDEMSARIVSLF